jgi:hypothetical protein
MLIKAMYKLPHIKTVLFIVNSLEEFSKRVEKSKENKKTLEYSGNILESRYCKVQKSYQQWKVQLVTETDFQNLLNKNMPKDKGSSNQSFDNLQELELMALNLLQIPGCLDQNTLHTPKVLSAVPSDDIIEVII